MADVNFSVCPFGSGININSSATQGSCTSGVVTLNAAESIPDVGDHIRFGATHLFIKQKNSDTEYVVTDKSGATPSDFGSTALSWIRHEYDSLALFEAGFTDTNHINNTDLTATGAAVSVGAPCYYDHGDGTLDTTQVDFTGHTQDSTYRVIVTGDAVNDGVYDNTTYYALEYTAIANSDIAINVDDSWTEFHNLQVTLTNSGSYTGTVALNVTGDTIDIHNCLIKGNISAASSEGTGIYFASGSNNCVVFNCLIYDFINGTNTCYGIDSDATGQAIIYYSDIINCYTGMANGVSGAIQAKNILIQNCNTDASGTFEATSDYNLTDIASGSSGLAGQSNTVFNTSLTFVDAANDDYHVAAGDTAARAGVVISGYTTDIDGETRNGTTPWIGFDEGAAASGFVGDEDGMCVGLNVGIAIGM